MLCFCVCVAASSRVLLTHSFFFPDRTIETPEPILSHIWFHELSCLGGDWVTMYRLLLHRVPQMNSFNLLKLITGIGDASKNRKIPVTVK